MGLGIDLWDGEEAESSSLDCRPLPVHHISCFLTAASSSLESGNLPFTPRKSSPGPTCTWLAVLSAWQWILAAPPLGGKEEN